MKSYKSNLVYLFFLSSIVFYMSSCKIISHSSTDPYENENKIYIKIDSDINQYKNGQKDGVWIMTNDSIHMLEICNYKNGVLDGTYMRFYDDGRIAVKGKYKNGKKDGLWYSYGGPGGGVFKYKNGEGIPVIIYNGSW